VGKSEVMNAAKPGGLGGTYAGSPIACAAALAVLEVIEEERLNQKALAQGSRSRHACTSWRHGLTASATSAAPAPWWPWSW
jgi:4-aminobutyrate aminotransferase-like enzyme